MKKGKKIEYLIKWNNYDDPEDNTWEPADDLEVADELIQIFENSMVQKKKLSENLENLHDDIINKTETTKTETKHVRNHNVLQSTLQWKNYMSIVIQMRFLRPLCSTFC